MPIGDFSYQNIQSKRYIKDTELNYTAAFEKDFFIVTFYEPAKEENYREDIKKGWKFHISVCDNSVDELVAAWNVIYPILIDERVGYFKVSAPAYKT